MKTSKFAKLAIVMLMSVVIAGCSNTLDGVGRDVEKAGQKIQKTF